MTLTVPETFWTTSNYDFEYPILYQMNMQTNMQINMHANESAENSCSCGKTPPQAFQMDDPSLFSENLRHHSSRTHET